MAKKIILIFLGIIILAVAGIAGYIMMVDWNTHRQEIADKFSEITGKKIEFSGPISVELLPQPTLNAKNVKVVNPNNTTEVLATIDNMNTIVSLQSLLKGTPDIQSMSLVGAEIWVNINEEGVLNWQSYKKSAEFNETDANNTRLQSLNIQNALLHFNNEAANLKFDLSQFNADIQADSLMGPYRLDGNFVKEQDHFGVAVSLGNFSGLSDVTVNFAITHPKSESFLRFDGTYMPNERTYKGDFSGGSKHTADFANILSGMKILDESYNRPLQFSMGMKTDNENLNLSSFVIKYDNFIEGSGNLTVPLQADGNKRRKIDLKYQLINLDLRPLLSIFKAEYKKFAENGSVYAPDSSFDINADITAEKVILNSSDTGSLESVSFKGSWLNNTLSLDEFYAACPGNMVLSMSGSLVEENTSPQYFLKISLEGKDFQAFLNALGLNVKTYTQATYRNAAITFNLSGNNSAVSVNDLKFLLDKMNIAGVAGVTFNTEGNIYEIQLAADSLNLDNYLPKAEFSTAMENLREDIKSLSFLKWLNINAKFKSDKLTFRNVTMSNAVLNLDAANGKVHISELSADNALNSQFKISATADNLASLDFKFDEIIFDLQSRNMAEIQDRLGLPWPKWNIFKANNFIASGSYSGNLHEGNLNAKVTADDVKLTYLGKVKQDNEFGFDGKLNLKTTNFSEFISNVGGSVKTNANTRGALNCNGIIKGSVSAWNFDDTTCILGISNYQGSGVFAKNKNNYRLNAKIKVDDFNIENVINVQQNNNLSTISRLRDDNFITRPDFSKETIVFDSYRNLLLNIDLATDKAVYKDKVFNNLRLQIINSENILQLNNISAQINEFNVAGNIQINYIQSPSVKGNLTFRDIDLKGIGGNIYQFANGRLNVVSDFEMPANSIEEFVGNFTGSINFEAADASLIGFDFAKIKNDLKERQYSKGLFQLIRDSLQSGETSFSVFSGKIIAERGNLKYDNFVWQNEDTDIKITGNINLNEWKFNNYFNVTFPDLEQIPPFTFNLSGLINKPSLDINVENIAKKYDAYWDSVEAAEQAKKAEAEKALTEAMNEAQEKVTQVSENGNKLVPVLETYKENSDDEKFIVWYQQHLDRINEINKALDLMQGKAHLPNYTNKDVLNIENDCQKFLAELETLETEISSNYSQDVKQRFTRVVESGEKYSEKSNKKVESYRLMVQNNFDALLAIEASQVMLSNQTLQNNQSRILELNDKIISQQGDFSALKEEGNSLLNDIPSLEKLTITLKEKFADMQNNMSEMEKIYDSTDSLLQQIYQTQQQLFFEREAKREAAKKAAEAEAAKNLLNEVSDNDNDDIQVMPTNSIKQTPPDVQVRENHIDDGAPQTTVEINPEKRPTLRQITDETVVSNKTAVSGTIKKSYDEKTTTAAKKSNSLLKEVDGAVQKPTGTIVVK